MNLRDLEYFKYLAESLSFTKTAEHFFVSQPSISIALKRLEDEFNTTLIKRERSAKNIHLTSSGRLLYQRTIDMLGLYGQTKNEINDIDLDTIRLGIIPAIGNFFLPKLLTNANSFLNNLKLIEEQSTDQLINSLRNNRFPIAIVGHDKPDFSNKWLHSRLIASSPLKLFVARHHALAHYRELSILELHQLPFVSLTSGTIHERMFQNWMIENHLPFDNVLYCQDIDQLTALVTSGERVALLMDSFSINPEEVIALPIKNAPIGYIHLAQNNEVTLTENQKAFNDMLFKTLQ